MRALWEDAAREDVGEAASYIDLDRPAKGEELVLAITAVVERLTTFPLSSRQSTRKRSREAVVVGWPYVVIYIVDADTVHILRVFHTSRRWRRFL